MNKTETKPNEDDQTLGTPGLAIGGRRVALAILVSLILFSGVVHGYLDGRWATPADLVAQGDRLGELPETFGDWALLETSSLDDGAAKLLRCYGSQVRVYRNEKTQALVNVAVLFGPRGPIAVHTPEVCYSSVGTKQVGSTRAETIDAGGIEHRLWNAQFAQDSQPDPTLDVWYGWSDGGPFQASDYPRFWLTDSLYKIQVAGSIGEGGKIPCRDFITAFLPFIQQFIQ